MTGGYEAKGLGYSGVAIRTDQLTESVRHPLLEGYQRVGDEKTCNRLADTPEIIWGKYHEAIEHLERVLGEEDRFILTELIVGAIYDAQVRAIQIAKMSHTDGLPNWGELYGIPNPEAIE